jgi:L-lactate dehydrogenase complex protein LldF
VDNGRSRILADKAFRESLRCIRCGACLNTCPVYLKIGGHAYGWVYSGPVGSILTPQLLKDRRCTSTLPFASTLCGACADVCPVKIDIPRILAELRSRFAEDPEWGPAPLSEHGLFRLAGTVLSDRLLYEGAGSIARTLYPLIRRTGPADTFPPPASRPFRRSHKQKSRKGRKDAHRG